MFLLVLLYSGNNVESFKNSGVFGDVQAKLHLISSLSIGLAFLRVEGKDC